MKRKIILVLAILILLFSITTIFADTRGVGKGKGNPLQCVSASQEDIRIAIHLLDSKLLVARFGERNNPFISLGSLPLTVFNISVDSPMDIKLNLYDIVLKRGGASSVPIRRFRLKRYWKNKLDKPSGYLNKYRGWSSGVVSHRVRQNMLPEKLDIRAGEHFEGLLIFGGRIPQFDDITLIVPVYSNSGNLIHPFRFEYTR